MNAFISKNYRNVYFYCLFLLLLLCFVILFGFCFLFFHLDFFSLHFSFHIIDLPIHLVLTLHMLLCDRVMRARMDIGAYRNGHGHWWCGHIGKYKINTCSGLTLKFRRETCVSIAQNVIWPEIVGKMRMRNTRGAVGILCALIFVNLDGIGL